MTYRIIVQPSARRDIAEVAQYLRRESGSASAAVRWARGLQCRIRSLETNPQICPVDPDSVAYGHEVRVLLFGKRPGVYRVLFAIVDDAVQILAVRHAARRTLEEEMEGS